MAQSISSAIAQVLSKLSAMSAGIIALPGRYDTIINNQGKIMAALDDLKTVASELVADYAAMKASKADEAKAIADAVAAQKATDDAAAAAKEADLAAQVEALKAFDATIKADIVPAPAV